jgi:hypothetical protein
VARENPAVAPVAAVTAATLDPKRIEQITKAAVAAAPSQAGKIVAALIKKFPKDYGLVAIAAADAAPSAGRDILSAVAGFIPALQTGIQGATAKLPANGGNIPVQAILTQSYNAALASGTAASTLVSPALTPPMTTGAADPALAPPTIGPPYTPITQPINNIGPGDITPQQPGGRNYASP